MYPQLTSCLTRSPAQSCAPTTRQHRRQMGFLRATANAHARIEWPWASKPWPYTVTGRSILRPLSEPSMVLLRIRAMFGLGARSEILRCLLFSHNRQFTAAMLASATNYAKRNVAESCDTLVQAGVLATREVSRRYYYSLANPGPLADFVGALPELVVDWPLLFRFSVFSSSMRMLRSARATRFAYRNAQAGRGGGGRS